MEGRVLVLLVSLLHLVASLKKDCAKPCIPVVQCKSLLAMIRVDVRVVQEATCSIDGLNPLVCCPDNGESSTASPVTPEVVTTQPVFTTDLLPKDCGHFAIDDRIFGGKQTSIGSYPWMAALGYRRKGGIKYLCGGALINNRYVLTAAHCFREKLEVIRLGEWDLTTEEDCEINKRGQKFCAPQPPQDFGYEEIISHNAYNTRQLHSDDIGLIRLNRPVDISRSSWIQPVCLPERNLDVQARLGNRKAVVIGWGFTEEGTTSDRLLQVHVPYVDLNTCNTTFRGELGKSNEQLCFGGERGKDSCGGDSGGPLMVPDTSGPPYTQIGVVSYGFRDCGQENVPAVYTAVSHYMNWIVQNLKP